VQLISELQKSRNSSLIRTEAKRLGFYDCGFSKAEHLPEDEVRVEDWLSKGMHGEMSWLERNKEKRYNPAKLVEGAKSVITVIYNYKPGEKMSPQNNYKISNYAYGHDYHEVLKNKLHLLLGFIEDRTGKRSARVFVDSAPVLDRAWANRSGLGFIGKNTMLINRKGGSYFFIGHVVLDLELEYASQQPEKNFCGSCTLCLKACPTKALEPFVLDARKCISYLTIEHRSEIPEKFKDQFEDWIFGCDICQEVCPWNRDTDSHQEILFRLSDELKLMTKSYWEKLEKDQFNILFQKSAVQRTGFQGMKRNISYLKE
jgi:epoxyqueuosine reductase